MFVCETGFRARGRASGGGSSPRACRLTIEGFGFRISGFMLHNLGVGFQGLGNGEWVFEFSVWVTG